MQSIFFVSSIANSKNFPG